MYRVVVEPRVGAQIRALPDGALQACWDVLAAIELTPWNGEPQHSNNPEGAVRRWLFPHGGQVVYLVLERRREVHVLVVQWVG